MHHTHTCFKKRFSNVQKKKSKSILIMYEKYNDMHVAHTLRCMCSLCKYDQRNVRGSMNVVSK